MVLFGRNYRVLSHPATAPTESTIEPGEDIDPRVLVIFDGDSAIDIFSTPCSEPVDETGVDDPVAGGDNSVTHEDESVMGIEDSVMGIEDSVVHGDRSRTDAGGVTGI